MSDVSEAEVIFSVPEKPAIVKAVKSLEDALEAASFGSGGNWFRSAFLVCEVIREQHGLLILDPYNSCRYERKGF